MRVQGPLSIFATCQHRDTEEYTQTNVSDLPTYERYSRLPPNLIKHLKDPFWVCSRVVHSKTNGQNHNSRFMRLKCVVHSLFPFRCGPFLRFHVFFIRVYASSCRIHNLQFLFRGRKRHQPLGGLSFDGWVVEISTTKVSFVMGVPACFNNNPGWQNLIKYTLLCQ